MEAAAPLLAGLAALSAGAILRVGFGAAGFTSRGAALAHLLPEALLAFSSFLLVSLASGALRKSDLAMLSDLLPSHGASPAPIPPSRETAGAGGRA